MTDAPQPKAQVRMVKNKEGILVPEEAVDRCLHIEVVKRIQPQLPQYVCGDCTEKLKFVTLKWALMTNEEFKEFQIEQARRMAVAIRQQRTGLVTPGEAEAEKQQRSGPKVVPPRKGPQA